MRWNFVAIMYKSRNIRYFLSTSGQWSQCSISNIPRRRTVFSLVSPGSPIPKTRVSPLLSCIRRGEYVMSYLVPVNCSHLWFTIHTDIGQYSHSFLICLTPKISVYPLEFRCYLVYELRYTLFLIYFRLMATILDLRYTQTSDSILTSLSVLPDPETCA